MSDEGLKSFNEFKRSQKDEKRNKIMGRLTEYYQYLETPPDKLMDFKFRSAWITIKDEDKKLRRKLKLYQDI